ncbi:MAG: mevalonate kinase [Anaerolineales bacterium]|nr:mevalonate kinase [Anaerolineales bacterium]
MISPARAAAPGKVILLGEHAVVYGQPALAVPVAGVQAVATVTPPAGPQAAAGLWIEARAIGRRYRLEAARPADPLALAARLTLERCAPGAPPPAGTLTIDSTIPIASGLGSGAAVCTAAVRALAAALGRPLPPAEVSALVFQTETLLHGTPSGIDNTVIAYGQPVWFVKGQPPEPFTIAAPFQLLIADTGQPSPTRITVGDVRAAWQQAPARWEAVFQAIGALVREARALLAAPAAGGGLGRLGELLDRNHAHLRELGVSSPELEALTAAARAAGALGAKLSGGGRGGNLIALVEAPAADAVEAALLRAGAKRVLRTMVGAEAQ